VINSTGVYWLNRPADRTAPYTQSQLGTLTAGSYVVTADVTGDGRSETVVTDSGAGTIGYWQKPVVLPAPAPIQVIPSMPSAATEQPTQPVAAAPVAAAPTPAAAPVATEPAATAPTVAAPVPTAASDAPAPAPGTAPTVAGDVPAPASGTAAPGTAPTVAGETPVPAPDTASPGTGDAPAPAPAPVPGSAPTVPTVEGGDAPAPTVAGDAPPDIAPPLQGQTLPPSTLEPTAVPTAAETPAATAPLLNAAVTLSGGFRIYTGTTAGVVPSPGQLVGGIMSALGLRVAELTVSLTSLSDSEQQAQQQGERGLAAPAAAAAAVPDAVVAQSDAPYVDAAFTASFRAGGAAGLNVGAGTFADGSAGSTDPVSSDETASTAAARAIAVLSSTGASLLAAAVGVPPSAVLLLAVVACKEGLQGGCLSLQLDSSSRGIPPTVALPPGNGVIYFFGLFFLLLVATAAVAWAALELLLRHYRKREAAAAVGRGSGASPRKPQLNFTPHRRSGRKQRPAKTQPYPLYYSPEQQSPQQQQQQQQQQQWQQREPVPSPAGRRPKQLFEEDELAAVPSSPFHLATARASAARQQEQQQEVHSSATESSRASSSSASHSRWHSSITAQVKTLSNYALLWFVLLVSTCVNSRRA
jgi:hypothetical protein